MILKIQFVAKSQIAKYQRGPNCPIFFIFEKKRKMRILNSLIVPKYIKGETLWDFQTSIMFQNIKKIEGGTLWYNQKIFEKKSHSAEKKSKLKTPR